ncbi:MAG: hypothetical protein JWP37_2084 [Mucilaginibacter sp.]|nr:hypothetical protein [Mucilaginibacter sp.]
MAIILFNLKKLRAIITIALTANLLTLLLYNFAGKLAGKSEESSANILYCIMFLWFVTFLTALYEARQKNLFDAKLCLWSVLVIQFCTPFPILSVYYSLH